MRNERYFRQVTASVLQWYLEFEDGLIASQFEPRILDYRIDVERIFDRLNDTEQDILLSVHRDGLSPNDAVRLAGWSSERAERLVAMLEVKLGQELVRQDMLDLVKYLSRG